MAIRNAFASVVLALATIGGVAGCSPADTTSSAPPVVVDTGVTATSQTSSTMSPAPSMSSDAVIGMHGNLNEQLRKADYALIRGEIINQDGSGACAEWYNSRSEVTVVTCRGTLTSISKQTSQGRFLCALSPRGSVQINLLATVFLVLAKQHVTPGTLEFTGLIGVMMVDGMKTPYDCSFIRP